MTEPSARPYTMDEQPTSTSRLFLARAFAHWCVLHYGCGPDEVEAALSDGHDEHEAIVGDRADDPTYDMAVDDDGHARQRDRRRIRDSARLIGELAAAGRLRTYARPMGGGENIELKAGAWELDEYRARFASSAIDPLRPFDAEAAPTHWIFVDMDGFNALTAESCGESPPAATGAGTTQPTRFLRLPEVKARTGMSRSTIYNRIRDKQFPEPRNLGGNISAWPEAELDRWIADRAR